MAQALASHEVKAIVVQAAGPATVVRVGWIVDMIRTDGWAVIRVLLVARFPRSRANDK
jgi:hypothetical protein